MNEETGSPMPAPAGAFAPPPVARGGVTMLPLWAVLIGLASVEAVLALHRVTHRDTGHDEGVSHWMATTSWRDVWDVVSAREVNGVLHTLMLRVWSLFGDDIVWLRTMSVVAAIGAVVVTFLLGRTLFGQRAGLVASLILAFHPLLGQHAQSARAYAVATLLTVLTTAALATAVDQPSSRRWAMYSASATALVYAHLFGLFVLAGHGVAIAVTGRRLVGLRRPALAAAATGVLLTPIWMILATGDRNQLDWIDRLTLGDYERVAVVLGANWRVLAAGFLVCAVVTIAAAVAAARSGQSVRAWALTLVVCTGAAPVVLPAAISSVKPILVPHYLVLALPGVALTVAAGLDRVRNRYAVAVGAAVAVAFCAVSLQRQHERADREPWGQIAAYVVTNSEPGDGLIVHPGSGRLAFEYHAADGARRDSDLQPALPAEKWGELSVLDPPFSRATSEPAVRAAVAPFRRIWWVTDEADNAHRDEWDAVRAIVAGVLDERCRQGDEHDFGRYRVARFTCTPSQGAR